MRPRQIALLLVAAVTGLLVFWGWMVMSRPTPQQVIVQAAAPAPQHTADQVLVATADIGVGQRLDAKSVRWSDWPSSAIGNDYITQSKSPDAIDKISGAVARFEIFPGDPIHDSKLVHSDQGFLSAVLEPGMRGVSINVSAAAGSGGFIIPNDRVDVLLTSTTGGQTNSRVVLSDVKVLAIGTRLGQTGQTGAPKDPDPATQVFTNDTIATLELTPAQAQALVTATAQGKISLVLRSVADFGKTTAVASVSNDSATVPVQIIRFGRTATVTPGSSDSGAAGAGPAPYVAPAVDASAPVASADSSSTPDSTPPVTTVTTVQTGPTVYAPGATP